MGSPVPIVIIFDQNNIDNSLVFKLTEKSIAELDGINTADLERLDQKFIKDKKLFKMNKISAITIVKDKIVTTKPL